MLDSHAASTSTAVGSLFGSPRLFSSQLKKKGKKSLFKNQDALVRAADGGTSMQDWRRLPLEIWFDILMLVHPDAVGSGGGRSEKDEDADERCWMTGTVGSTTAAWGGRKFHPSISLSPSPRTILIPTLIVFGSVCRIMRKASFFHPFWTDLSWHRLLPLPRSPTEIPLGFFTTMCILERTARIRRVYLDLEPSKFTVAAGALTYVFERLRPEQIKEIVIEVSWSTTADPSLLRSITCRFPNISRLHIMGSRARGILYSLGDDDLHALARTIPTPNKRPISASIPKPLQAPNPAPPLTHLSLDGFGRGGFSWHSLRHLIQKTSATLRHLALSDMRGGIDLTDLSRILPSLKSLCISFSPSGSVGGDEEDDDVALGVLRTPRAMFVNPKLRPLLLGDLAGFINLEALTLRGHPFSSPKASKPRREGLSIPVPMITALLASLPGPPLSTNSIEIDFPSFPSTPLTISTTGGSSPLRLLHVEVDSSLDWMLDDLNSAMSRLTNLVKMAWVGSSTLPSFFWRNCFLRWRHLKVLEVGKEAADEVLSCAKAELLGVYEEDMEFWERVKGKLEETRIIEL
ncbi:hypothetical protein HDU67_006979 [Dinochytrium kinnereticum]|nr:hypothetical protein HDU67_006979 [Dinochytrium kinnereticum]